MSKVNDDEIAYMMGSRKPIQWQLLSDNEPIPPDAEYLDENCVDWRPLKGSINMRRAIGMRYDARLMQPMRAPSSETFK